jgi:tetratricopeptide (TPR) repeat protein
MINWTLSFVSLICLAGAAAHADGLAPIARGKWFQFQTPNFTIVSSGSMEHTRKVATKLEQFRESYSKLAGAKAVASVPVIVVVFPNQESFRPFQPRYEGQPKNAAGFFQRDYDENVIALNAERMESGSMEVIFHEYTHLLMRHNARVWPLWLQEGMADVYSTFAVSSLRVCIGTGKSSRVQFFRRHEMMPLPELFDIGHDSPQYNEREQTGVFYAQSWLLTHYLMFGSKRKAQLEVFMRRLRDGVEPKRAFAETFPGGFTAIEAELRQYLAKEKFEPICFDIAPLVKAEKPSTARALTPVEILYHLGNLLLHLQRLDEAEEYFIEANKIAPNSPLPYEGRGLVSARRNNRVQAVALLEQALARRSASFRAHYEYARALLTTRDGLIVPRNLPPETLAKARNSLQRSIRLMPLFAPAHFYFGVLEREADEGAAFRHLQKAIDLDPDDKQYSLALAQFQIHRAEYTSARRTLKPLLAPAADPEIRRRAETLMKTLDEAAPP